MCLPKDGIMGQIKKILATIEFVDNPIKKMDIELNIGPNGSSDHVHLQTRQWRLEFFKAGFIQFASSIIIAASKLRKIKKI